MTTKLSTRDLVKHYINISDTALASPDANPLVSLSESVMTRMVSGQTIDIEVVDDAGATLGHYTTRFVDGRFTPVQEKTEDPDRRFTLSRSFLSEVVENGDHYLAHPEDLDWSWLAGGWIRRYA